MPKFLKPEKAAKEHRSVERKHEKAALALRDTAGWLRAGGSRIAFTPGCLIKSETRDDGQHVTGACAIGYAGLMYGGPTFCDLDDDHIQALSCGQTTVRYLLNSAMTMFDAGKTECAAELCEHAADILAAVAATHRAMRLQYEQIKEGDYFPGHHVTATDLDAPVMETLGV